jgi:hypothetical protein
LKCSKENGLRPHQDLRHPKQKNRPKRGNQIAAQQALSGEAGETTEEQIADQSEATPP